jgi:hypothetical protein
MKQGDIGRMKPTRNFVDDRLDSSASSRALWIALIVISGVCLSPFFACATPFAALATVAALKLDRRDMVCVAGLVWLANQAIGYGFLSYPRTWDSAAWGLAIGVSATAAIAAARSLSTVRRAPLAVSLPFVAAFTAFELGLYLAGFLLPGSEGAFTLAVIGNVFVINAVTLCGLMAVSQFAMLVGFLTGQQGPGAGETVSAR